MGANPRREIAANEKDSKSREEGRSDTRPDIVKEVFELKTIQIHESFELNEIGITVI